MVEARRLDELEQVLEMLLGLAREADDEGRAQEDVRRESSRLLEQAQVALRRAAPAHGAEDLRMAVLERHVDVGHEALLAPHQPQELLVERRRIGVEEADPGKGRTGEQRLDEPHQAVLAESRSSP